MSGINSSHTKLPASQPIDANIPDSAQTSSHQEPQTVRVQNIANSISMKPAGFSTPTLVPHQGKEKLKQILPQAIASADQYLKKWNEDHGGSDAATNLATMRLFKDENGKGRVVGVTAGNQRLIAINARTGAVQQLNNTQGSDDCSSKSFIGGRMKGYENDEVETFDITLDFPIEDVILVALTDGAWQNFEKGADQGGNPNPYLIDCTKLQSVLIAGTLQTPLLSQTVMERLTQHVAERSLTFRKEVFQLSQELSTTREKADVLQVQLKAEHQSQFEGKPVSETATRANTQRNIAKDTLRTRQNKHLSSEKIVEAEANLKTAEEEFKNLPSIFEKLYFISQKTDPSEGEESLQEMEALEQEILQKELIENTDKNSLTYIQKHISLLREFLALNAAKHRLEKEIEKQSRALDDVTITALSPFGEPNPFA